LARYKGKNSRLAEMAFYDLMDRCIKIFMIVHSNPYDSMYCSAKHFSRNKYKSIDKCLRMYKNGKRAWIAHWIDHFFPTWQHLIGTVKDVVDSRAMFSTCSADPQSHIDTVYLFHILLCCKLLLSIYSHQNSNVLSDGSTGFRSWLSLAAVSKVSSIPQSICNKK
jgi:hypothetical protein